MFALVPAPFIVWQMALYAHFRQFGVASGGATGSGFELLPFGGFIRILTEGGELAFFLTGTLAAAAAVLPALWGLWRTFWDVWQRTGTQETIMLFFQAFIMPFVPFSTYSEPIGIIRFVVGLQIAVMWYAARHHHKRALVYSTLWFMTSAFVIYSDVAR